MKDLSVAAIEYHVLRAYAIQDHLSNKFVLACMNISAWESAFDPTAQNHQDPGPWGSAGPWQINSKAYPAVTFDNACNPFWSTWFWLYHQGAERRWLDMEGERLYTNDPIGFIQQFAPAVQVSEPWNRSIALTAIGRTQEALEFMFKNGLY